MSKMTSTAALDSFCRMFLRHLRRLPRHPAGATNGSGPPKVRDIRKALPVILRVTLSLVLWTLAGKIV